MEYEHLIYQRDGAVARVTLNRPERLNALNNRLRYEICMATQEAGDDPDVRVVVVSGAGRAFSPGDDLRGGGTTDPPSMRRSPGDMVLGIRALRKPVIAAIHGYCHGAGLKLALACDIRIAAEGTLFAQPFVLRGIGYGGYLLPRYIGLTRATEMLFTGEPIDAATALQWGLVNRVVPADRLAEEVSQWEERFAKAATAAIGSVKAIINGGLSLDLVTGHDFMAREGASTQSTEDRAEGRKAFAEKREPVFKGR